MEEKKCCFAGHRYEFNCYGVTEEKLHDILEKLILEGFTIFYDGNLGYFDKLCRSVLYDLKKQYTFIKIISVKYYYNHKKDIFDNNDNFDKEVFVGLENVHYKQKIIKRNQWIVDNSDCMVCHIKEPVYSRESGAKRMLNYAKKKGIRIISV